MFEKMSKAHAYSNNEKQTPNIFWCMAYDSVTIRQ